MEYPVGKLLTREYNDIERRILQAKLFYTNDSWYKNVRFIAKDGSCGVKQVTDEEVFDIDDLIRYIRLLPLLECLTDDIIYSMAIRRFYISPRIINNYHTLMQKYQWLYNNETGVVIK